MEKAKENTLTIIHFNDVYNIMERGEEPVGGVARFYSALRAYDHLNPLILFSGDAFSPSTLSPIYKGEHMLKPLNSFGIHVACVGNHDFDFDKDITTSLFERTNFPWLITNVKMRDTGLPFAPCKEYHILKHKNLKIGFIGLAEYEWISTLNTLTKDDLDYEDFVLSGERWTKYLKEEHKCDLVIALTHMRDDRDKILAKESTDIDLILGGHDHVYHNFKLNDKFVIKSGTDFREFNVIKLEFLMPDVINQINSLSSVDCDIVTSPSASINSTKYKGENICKTRFHVEIEKVEITKQWKPDPDLESHVHFYIHEFEKKMAVPVAHTSINLESRFSKIRTEETNLGNLLADLCKIYIQADVALINAGAIRSDCIIPKGLLTLKDIKNILPMPGKLVKLEVTGDELIQVLEIGVSRYPNLEGRFPCVSGITFIFDPKQDTLKRIVRESIRINNNPLELDKKYTLACRNFIASGKDGYDLLAGCTRLSDEDIAEEIDTIFFKFLLMVNDKDMRADISKRFLNSRIDLQTTTIIPTTIITNTTDTIYSSFNTTTTIIINEDTTNIKHNNSNNDNTKRLNKKLQWLDLVNDIRTIEGNEYIEIAPTVTGRITTTLN